jgi:hypothetical protein
MRFIRNEHLKKHLDSHFIENNEIIKKKKYNPSAGAIENRPLFNSFKGWVSQNAEIGSSTNPSNALESKENVGTNIVAFVPGQDTNCFMCKEKLKLEKDGAPKQLSNSEADENCYFVSAKKIRVSLKNKTTNQVEKKEVTVHVECMKQLEDMK